MALGDVSTNLTMSESFRGINVAVLASWRILGAFYGVLLTSFSGGRKVNMDGSSSCYRLASKC